MITSTLDRTCFRQRRDALGLTLKDVADKTGLHLTTIHKLEVGKGGGVDWDTVAGVMQVLGLTFSEVCADPALYALPVPALAPA
ncbi:helix-turn-helix domain-containing protein [Deinococcus petrolearius]|uniref:Helix-turn-helix domain-containing protein n=1 Tax=Deinococcus petrolearius TaxID=1751295 RepID=A0ABW1DDE3_9DEIO